VSTAVSTYSGFGFSLRGEKNRFVLPPAFRNKIFDASGERNLCLARHELHPCLIGFGTNYIGELEQQFQREQDHAERQGLPFDAMTRRMQLFGYTEMPFDSSGRFILPDHLMKVCGLTDSFCVIGAGKFFAIWAPAELYGMGDAYLSAKEACRSLEEEARTKGRKE
jgi:MraZ protein